MDKKYQQLEDNKLVVIGRSSIEEFCNEKEIDIKDFNYPVILKEGIDCYALFSDCTSFNQPVVIPQGITSCELMFCGCRNFNQSIIIPPSIQNCEAMFMGCDSFNQPIEIPYGVENCCGMFSMCKSFNQPLKLPSTVIYCSSMFFGCRNLNSPIMLSDNTKNIDEMFCLCTTLNQPLTIPKSALVQQFSPYNPGFLGNCPNYKSKITILADFKSYTDLIYFLDRDRRFNIQDIKLPDETMVKHFDDILDYHIKNNMTELTAWLLQFKHDHKDRFPDTLKLD